VNRTQVKLVKRRNIQIRPSERVGTEGTSYPDLGRGGDIVGAWRQINQRIHS